jgi:hypothetical protein
VVYGSVLQQLNNTTNDKEYKMSEKTQKLVGKLIGNMVLIPVILGWMFMLLAGILHVKFGFPLFGYWESVGTVFVAQTVWGGFVLRGSQSFKAGQEND